LPKRGYPGEKGGKKEGGKKRECAEHDSVKPFLVALKGEHTQEGRKEKEGREKGGEEIRGLQLVVLPALFKKKGDRGIERKGGGGGKKRSN